MAMFPSPVDTYHTSSYDAIDPTRPDLSQKEKNVVITGAGSGIGQAVAVSFAKANVSNLALLGRRLEVLQETEALVKTANPNTKVFLYSADISDFTSLEKAFAVFAASVRGPIHTLIANAGQHPGNATLVDLPSEKFSNALLSNAIGTLNTIRAFMLHIPASKDTSGYRARILHTSSAAAQVDMPTNSIYSISKGTAAKIVQAFAVENPDVWFGSFHPGLIDSPMYKGSGYHFDNMDDVDLPADWSVWATSKGSTFVPSGRFLWAHWDVNELQTLFGKMKTGVMSDGEIAMGAFPIGQRFTLGLSGVPAL